MAEQYVNFILDSNVQTALTLEEIQSATAQGPPLQTVIETMNTGRWHEVKETASLGANSYALIRSVSGMSKMNFVSLQNKI